MASSGSDAAERAEARRTRLLDIAVDVALAAKNDTGAWVHSVGIVRPADAAQRVGVSRTWMYRLWPTKQEFWHDLAVYECRRDGEVPAAIGRWYDRGPIVMGDPRNALREAINRVVEELRGSPRSVTYATVLGYSLPAEIAEVKLVAQRRATDEIERPLVGWLRTSGRRPVPGLTVRDLADVLTLLIDGTRMVDVVAPWILRDDWLLEGGRHWTVLAHAFRVLLGRATTAGPLDAQPARLDPASPFGPDRWTDLHRSVLAAASEVLDAKLAAPGPGLHAFGSLTVSRLARRAGVSRQTVYNIWSSDDALRFDLLIRLRAMHQAGNTAALSTWWRMPQPWADRALEFADAILMPRQAARVPMLAFLPHARDEAVAAELHGLNRRVVAEAADVYDAWDPSTTHRVDARHRAELAMLMWFACRRRTQLAVAAYGRSSPETARELALYAFTLNLFEVYGNDPLAPSIVEALSAGASTSTRH